MDNPFPDSFMHNMECQANLLRKLGKSEEEILKHRQNIINAVFLSAKADEIKNQKKG